MRIVIIGQGNMGAPLARLARSAGHETVPYDSRTDPVTTLAGADLVILAVKYEQAMTLCGDGTVVSALTGKIVVDVSNPLTPDYMGLTIGHGTSAAEEIARRLPGAHVVKAFNTVFAALLRQRGEGGSVAVPVFVAGDHEPSRQAVADLARRMGFNAIVAGALSNARYLEPMAELMIQLGYGLGHGDRIGFTLLDEATAAPVSAA